MIVNKQDEEYHLNCILIHLSRFSDPETLCIRKETLLIGMKQMTPTATF